jgi:hypothetical protein
MTIEVVYVISMKRGGLMACASAASSLGSRILRTGRYRSLQLHRAGEGQGLYLGPVELVGGQAEHSHLFGEFFSILALT